MAAAEGLGLEITELRLGLPGIKSTDKKRGFWEEESQSAKVAKSSKKNNEVVVGWPPVCSYRKKNSFNGRETTNNNYVKVSMDGAPILRKIDLACFTHYSHLISALHNLFHSFHNPPNTTAGEELNNGYVSIYEDGDGDWMLVGDVPWEMFTESCKRLRIMKRADATGIGLHFKSLH